MSNLLPQILAFMGLLLWMGPEYALAELVASPQPAADFESGVSGSAERGQRTHVPRSSPPAAMHTAPSAPDGAVLLAAVDGLEGPPPCSKDNICNLAVCANDPDCPAGMPDAATNDPSSGGPEHNEGGMGTSVWFSTGPPYTEGGAHVCHDNGTCDIMVYWTVQPDRYDKWKICWKEHGTLFENACDDNEKIRTFENAFYLIPKLKQGEEYRIRLEGRKDKNDKWKCLAKATLRNISWNDPRIVGTVPCIVP
ncbi:MAG: hypothetical protein KF814_04335 [Nitrospiraceae bacterium]|nr:hypothetical protein [Nitrospiraceae bacterium]